MIDVKTKFTIFNFNNPLINVITIKVIIPFINCHALVSLIIFVALYIKNITIITSKIVVTTLNGLDEKFSKILEKYFLLNSSND